MWMWNVDSIRIHIVFGIRLWVPVRGREQTTKSSVRESNGDKRGHDTSKPPPSPTSNESASTSSPAAITASAAATAAIYQFRRHLETFVLSSVQGLKMSLKTSRPTLPFPPLPYPPSFPSSALPSPSLRSRSRPP